MNPEKIENKLLEEALAFPIGRFLKIDGSVNSRKLKQLEPDFIQDALNLIFIRKAFDVHGKFFGYRNVNFRTQKQLVEIYCPDHEGFFKQTAGVHLAGHGCPLCKGKVITRDTEVGSFTVPCVYHKYSVAETSIIWYNKFSKIEMEIIDD